MRSIPDIPLWMALATAVPARWDPVLVYFGITVILSFLGWTNMARVVRGRFLALREEDFILAADLDGVPRRRIIMKHMIPSFTSHIIASVTLGIPGMILGETALSFLGLGLRQPVVSWGVMLYGTQNIRVLSYTPWLLVPGLAVMVTVLVFNFLGMACATRLILITKDAAGKRNMLLVDMQNLKLHFFTPEGVVKAVNGASYSVRRGKTLCVVGESGSGKSVAARAILQIVHRPGKIIGGKILYYKPVVADVSETIDITALPSRGAKIRHIRGNEIAMIFQEPMTSLSPLYTVGNQIIEAIRLHNDVSKKEARNRAIEMLYKVKIPKPEVRIDEYPFRLSGGMRQRCMIAMALSCNPQLLIADEPTTALDVTTQAQILDLMLELLADNGMSILFITHDLGVVAEIADDVAVMYLGRVVERGDVDTIFNAPKHPYTISLLRSIPKIGPTRSKLDPIRGMIPSPYEQLTGCPFHPRCDHKMAGVCDVIEPETLSLGENHQVQCLLYDETHCKEEVRHE